MRVTCPSCKAVYEAPDEAFGPGGRVVECSACDARWMQPGPDGPADAPRAPRAPSTVPGLSAAGAAMAELRGPAALPAPGAASEGPPSAAPAPAAPAPRAAARGAEARAPAKREPGSRHGLGAIDAQSLSAQLRGLDLEDPADEPGAGGGLRFAIGFALALILCAAAAAAYVEAGRIAQAVPEAAPWLERYVGAVDAARRAIETGALRLRDSAAAAVEALRGLIAG